MLGGASGAGAGERGGPVHVARHELQRGGERLQVLLLVLGHHAEDEAAAQQRGGRVLGEVLHPLERGLADAGGVGEGVLGGEQGQLAAGGARVAEGVVEGVEGGVGEGGGAERAQEPLLLVVGDVGHVPDDGGHEGRVLTGEGVLGEAVEHAQQPRASGGEGRDGVGLPGTRLLLARVPAGFEGAGHRASKLGSGGL